jgi:hypothetical protein
MLWVCRFAAGTVPARDGLLSPGLTDTGQTVGRERATALFAYDLGEEER